MNHQLSIQQQQILQILPIPSALMSVGGSSLIIYAAQRSQREKKLTSYGRLLFFLSLYDIQSSITYAMASFMRPHQDETSERIWSFGNASTCTAVGFLNQVSFSSTFFVCMLSCYFLLATRFGYTNEHISKRVEPVMHVTAIGYPLICSVVSLSQGWYGEVANGLSCWIRMRFPENCGTREEHLRICISEVVIWMFYVLPSFIALACLVINGLVMLQFVWHHHQRSRQIRYPKHNNKATASCTSGSKEDKDEENGDDDADDDHASSFEETTRIALQNGRLRMLASQSFLYFISFVLCNFATMVLVLLELKATSDEEQYEVIVNHFPLAVMQAIFHPLQGLLSMLIFVRPKYINYRNKYAGESRSTVARLALFGFDSTVDEAAKTPPVGPTAKIKQMGQCVVVAVNGGASHKSRETKASDQKSNNVAKECAIDHQAIPLAKDGMVSSLTSASEEEFELSLKGDNNDQVHYTKLQVKKKSGEERRRGTGEYIRSLRASELEMISELSESVFDSISIDTTQGGSRIINPRSRDPESECRWGSSTQSKGLSDVSPRLTLKISLDSSCRTTSEDDLDLSERRWGSSVGRRPSDMSLNPTRQSILRRIFADASSASSHESVGSKSSDGDDISIESPIIEEYPAHNHFRQLFQIPSDSSDGEHDEDLNSHS